WSLLEHLLNLEQSLLGEGKNQLLVAATDLNVHPDPEIFKNILEFSFEQLSTKLKELAYLNSGLEIVIVDERTDRKRGSRARSPRGPPEAVGPVVPTETPASRDDLVTLATGFLDAAATRPRRG